MSPRTLFISFLFVVTGSLALFSGPSTAMPFINEFHYDNAGSDIDEFVEVAGVAGTSLNGWSLAFYNGNNGRIYSTWSLSGVLTDDMNGFGALSFSGASTIQNGANDGIALIDDLGHLVQFLSYEGVLTAENGAAQGYTSIDVGVVEGSGTSVGYSIQLSGSGLDATDFSWQTGESSFGFVNAGQSFETFTTPALPPQSVPEPGIPGLLLFGLCLVTLKRLPGHFFSRQLLPAADSRYTGGFSA